jgi:hypothetical protein
MVGYSLVISSINIRMWLYDTLSDLIIKVVIDVKGSDIKCSSILKVTEYLNHVMENMEVIA